MDAKRTGTTGLPRRAITTIQLAIGEQVIRVGEASALVVGASEEGNRDEGTGNREQGMRNADFGLRNGERITDDESQVANHGSTSSPQARHGSR